MTKSKKNREEKTKEAEISEGTAPEEDVGEEGAQEQTENVEKKDEAFEELAEQNQKLREDYLRAFAEVDLQSISLHKIVIEFYERSMNYRLRTKSGNSTAVSGSSFVASLCK